jgi:hypothetical protein
MDNKEALAYWIVEREAVRIQHDAEMPKPWSQDWVFQQTYFCNVRREDDRVTKWIRQNWSPEKIGWADYEYAMVLSRFLNYPPTLEKLTHQSGEVITKPDCILAVLEGLAELGEKVWGNAYVVTTHGLPMGKAQYLCQRVLPAVYDLVGANQWRNAYPTSGPTLAQRYEDYTQLEGMGSFMSAQVIADLKNTPGHPLYDADDWATWSAPGPGSLRGLAWFYDRKISFKEYPNLINGVRDYLATRQGLEPFKLLSHPEKGFNMQDLQNCLCEYDKYMRVRTDSGRSKRSYPGRG